jgi:hypothetical protein
LTPPITTDKKWYHKKCFYVIAKMEWKKAQLLPAWKRLRGTSQPRSLPNNTERRKTIRNIELRFKLQQNATMCKQRGFKSHPLGAINMAKDDPAVHYFSESEITWLVNNQPNLGRG